MTAPPSLTGSGLHKTYRRGRERVHALRGVDVDLRRGELVALWPVLGRPGAVLVDGRIAGTWRARKAGRRTDVTVQAWEHLPADRVAEQAEMLASFRGTALGACAIDS